MRKIILVTAMVLVSAGAQAGGSRSLSLAGSDSKSVQESAKTAEPASAVNAPRVPKSASATSGEATGSTETRKSAERQKFAERPPGVDVRRQSQMQQSRMRAHTSQRRAAPHMAGMGMHRPVHIRLFSKARIVAALHRHGIYW